MWDKALQFSQISPEKWNSFNQLVSHPKSHIYIYIYMKLNLLDECGPIISVHTKQHCRNK